MPELGVPEGIVSADAVIKIDGQDKPELNNGLLSVLVEETSAGLCRCEARFGNWGGGAAGPDYLYLDRELLDFGKELILQLGTGAGQGVVFRGRISAIEAQYAATAPPSVVVLAEDRLVNLRTVRRSRVFEQMSDADAFQQIAGEHGLQPAIDLAGPPHTLLAQVNQSDLAFLRERARRIDAELWVDDRTLHAQSRSARVQAGAQDLTLVLGHGLLEFSVTADLANQYTSVIVSGWDMATKSKLSYAASESVLGGELNGDRSGASLLQSTFAARTARITRQSPMTSAEAQLLAESSFRAHARRFVCGVGLARGDARLRVGLKVGIADLGDLFNGAYVVTEVRHSFIRCPGGGYTSEFRVERPGVGREP
jgi:phage protein D